MANEKVDVNYNGYDEDYNVTYYTMDEVRQVILNKVKMLVSELFDKYTSVRKDTLVTPVMLSVPGVGKTSIVSAAVREVNKYLATHYTEEELQYKSRTRVYDKEAHTWKVVDKVEKVDANGNPVLDDNGKPVMVDFTRPKKLKLKNIKLANIPADAFEPLMIMNTTTGNVDEYVSKNIPVEEFDGNYGVLFFDEITSATVDLLQPFLGATDDTREVNRVKLPDHWLCVGAGNDGGAANDAGGYIKAAVTRTLPMPIKLDSRDIAYFATLPGGDKDHPDRKKFHPLVQAFIDLFRINALIENNNMRGVALDTDNDQVACPRTWEHVSNKLYAWEDIHSHKPSNDAEAGLLPTGSYSDAVKDMNNFIGTRVGTQFVAFLQMQETTSFKYDVDKILEGKEAKCMFNQSNSVSVSKENKSQFKCEEWQAAFKVTLRAMLNRIDEHVSELKKIAYNQTKKEDAWSTYFDGGSGVPDNTELCKASIALLEKFANATIWLTETDDSEVFTQYVATFRSERPALWGMFMDALERYRRTNTTVDKAAGIIDDFMMDRPDLFGNLDTLTAILDI